MVRFPKFKSSYCSICKTHTKKKLNEYKTSEQSIKSQGKRRYDRKQKGYGGQTKPILERKQKLVKKP
uniref:Ribosomal protein L44 n=1 Tax=Amorphochlora amoebiformis TaxID=1561963 RepID=A0A0H5BLE4_9EUKA|nr:ribosomal protein L44 [Amorphochlora amoebiformis]